MSRAQPCLPKSQVTNPPAPSLPQATARPTPSQSTPYKPSKDSGESSNLLIRHLPPTSPPQRPLREPLTGPKVLFTSAEVAAAGVLTSVATRVVGRRRGAQRDTVERSGSQGVSPGTAGHGAGCLESQQDTASTKDAGVLGGSLSQLGTEGKYPETSESWKTAHGNKQRKVRKNAMLPKQALLEVFGTFLDQVNIAISSPGHQRPAFSYYENFFRKFQSSRDPRQLERKPKTHRKLPGSQHIAYDC